LTDLDFEDTTPRLVNFLARSREFPQAELLPGRVKVGLALLQELLLLGVLREDETIFEALEIGPYLPGPGYGHGQWR
jgi:hypothetical protein